MSIYPDVSGSDGHKGEYELDHSVLERYWCGEASEDETARIEAWFVSHPQELAWYEQLRDGVRAPRRAQRANDARLVRIQAIVAAIDTSGISAPPSVSPVEPSSMHLLDMAPSSAASPAWVRGRLTQRTFWSRSYSIAAAALVMISLALGWSINAHRVKKTFAAQSSVYSTANGERATIRLPDGTVVVLNVASRLVVPGDYPAGNRVVHLEGEALFRVQHQDKHPFTVRSGPSITRVLGTSFVVRHYNDDSVAQVAVHDGKVAVESGASGSVVGRSVVVTGAQRVTVARHGVGSIQSIAGDNPSFELGVLHLERMPVHNAVKELNRWYDVDIRFGDASLDDAMIGGQFSGGSVLELMEQLTSGLDVQIHRNGRVLTLYQGRM